MNISERSYYSFAFLIYRTAEFTKHILVSIKPSFIFIQNMLCISIIKGQGYLMLRKILFPLILAVTFSTQASALNGKGWFKKKTHKIKGTWSLKVVDGYQTITFNRYFKTEDGPDLKIVLSKQHIHKLGKNPTLKDAYVLEPLTSNKGAQTYKVPLLVEFEQYESVLIHSEELNILWGGFNIPEDNPCYLQLAMIKTTTTVSLTNITIKNSKTAS